MADLGRDQRIPTTSSFLLLLVRHLLLEAMHLLLVISDIFRLVLVRHLLLLVRHLFLIASCY